MSTAYKYDAIVIGAGPNGLAAAITIARTGRSVIVFEAKETIGGGPRSMELTLPGFVHDVCSAIHPLGLGSAFFRTLPLEQYGLEWIHPSAPLAHPLNHRSAVILERSIEATGAALGRDAQLEEYNANYIGGDINGGVQDLWQMFTRPTIQVNPYATPIKAVYLCSSATPPGGGVHGLCGYYAARAALRGIETSPLYNNKIIHDSMLYLGIVI